MPLIQLTPAQRKQHRALAHALDPVVFVGDAGLNDAVVKETDTALNAHGLIKVRVFSDDRSVRETTLATLADTLNAAPIQHIGKVLVLWRPLPDRPAPVVPEGRLPGPRTVKVLKYASRGGQRPEVKTLRVLGNQRLTPAGQVKRARPRRPVSLKKRQPPN